MGFGLFDVILSIVAVDESQWHKKVELRTK
jgi:hypothetical protein